MSTLERSALFTYLHTYVAEEVMRGHIYVQRFRANLLSALTNKYRPMKIVFAFQINQD
jgi:hypothetical protein